jgi:transcriptional regulator with XRE-family HTH domain
VDRVDRVDRRNGWTGQSRRMERREFAAFLRVRRERIDPRELGLPVTGRRRTPGLRREEVAQLAGLSVDYYTRLEQGRDLQPSAAVVESLAHALRLGPAERDHLFQLGRREPAPRRTPEAETVRPSVCRVLAALEPNPAFLISRRTDVLAWNRPCTALLTDFGQLPPERRNMAILVFLDPRSREVYGDWEQVAREMVGVLRGSAGRHPRDRQLHALIERLSADSADFLRHWTRHDVQEKTTGSKEFRHPAVGRFNLDYEVLLPPGESDQNLIVYTAPAGSVGQAALDTLAAARPRAWAAPDLT